MSGNTQIQWTDRTWNVASGCTKVSPGCANCYIERTPPFRMNGRKFERGAIPVQLHRDRLEDPLHWKKPQRVFVNSLSDLFHDDVDDLFILEAFLVMAMASEHTFQVLTKRPERMQRLLSAQFMPRLWDRLTEKGGNKSLFSPDMWPLPNVWLGVSVENQHFADERIPLLLRTPAAVRFLSCEPLLGRLALAPFLPETLGDLRSSGIDWVIAGGESAGPPARSLVEVGAIRRMVGTKFDRIWRPKADRLEWVREIRDQCAAAGVPFFFKQWGGAPRNTSGGELLDGREWREFPS